MWAISSYTLKKCFPTPHHFHFQRRLFYLFLNCYFQNIFETYFLKLISYSRNIIFEFSISETLYNYRIPSSETFFFLQNPYYENIFCLFFLKNSYSGIIQNREKIISIFLKKKFLQNSYSKIIQNCENHSKLRGISKKFPIPESSKTNFGISKKKLIGVEEETP